MPRPWPRECRNRNACSLATADAQGRPSSRMLILKDIDGDGWHFATSRDVPQGPGTRGQPARGAEFYWPQQGRQVRVAGDVVELSAEASAADWDARPGADGSENPGLAALRHPPAEIEFWQARHDRQHIRHRYATR